jgi:hypothetical protein
MTFATASAFEGNRIMATTARIARVLVVAAGILALSITAAQAAPLDTGYHTFYRPQATAGGDYQGYHGFYRPQIVVRQASTEVAASPYKDYHGSYRPQPMQGAETASITGSGVDWAAGLLGAGTATLLLVLGFLAARRIRPQRVAQL